MLGGFSSSNTFKNDIWLIDIRLPTVLVLDDVRRANGSMSWLCAPCQLSGGAAPLSSVLCVGGISLYFHFQFSQDVNGFQSIVYRVFGPFTPMPPFFGAFFWVFHRSERHGLPGAPPALLLQNAIHSAWRRARQWQGSVQTLARDAGATATVPEGFWKCGVDTSGY